MTEKITPSSESHWLELRKNYINSTEISCLFDANPYMSHFELWHTKFRPENAMEIEQTERMSWGRDLEAVIAKAAAEKLGCEIEPMKDYYFDNETKLGSSFDWKEKKNSFILECKNVDFMAFQNHWTEEEAPMHIELQVQHQMLLSGINKAYICALVGGNKLYTYEREANEEIFRIILEKSKRFWAQKEAPKIDYEKDSSFIANLYRYAEPNKSIAPPEGLDELVNGYNVIQNSIKELKSQKEMFIAQILQLIQDAEKVKSENYTITCGIVQESEISYTRKPFRQFKITNKKQKEE